MLLLHNIIGWIPDEFDVTVDHEVGTIEIVLLQWNLCIVIAV